MKGNGKRKPATVRTAVFLAILAVVAVGYFTLTGIGNICAVGVDVFSLICPLGYLESLLAGKVAEPRALISFIAVVVLVLVLGRVFCAWVCPMPFLQRWMPGRDAKKRRKLIVRKKKAMRAGASEQAAERAVLMDEAREQGEPKPVRGGKPNRFQFDSRFGVLIGALASAALFGFPVFCLVCPVGLTFATVYLVMRLFAFGDVTWTVIAVPAVLLIEVLFLRDWCHKICPLGALMSLVSGGNKTLRPTIDDGKCISSSKGAACFACSAVCPEKLDIRRPELSQRSLNNCTKCRECAAHCPAQAITFPFLPKAAGLSENGGAQAAAVSAEAASETQAVEAAAEAAVATPVAAEPVAAAPVATTPAATSAAVQGVPGADGAVASEGAGLGDADAGRRS